LAAKGVLVRWSSRTTSSRDSKLNGCAIGQHKGGADVGGEPRKPAVSGLGRGTRLEDPLLGDGVNVNWSQESFHGRRDGQSRTHEPLLHLGHFGHLCVAHARRRRLDRETRSVEGVGGFCVGALITSIIGMDIRNGLTYRSKRGGR
jgi:hypothetical protein